MKLMLLSIGLKLMGGLGMPRGGFSRNDLFAISNHIPVDIQRKGDGVILTINSDKSFWPARYYMELKDYEGGSTFTSNATSYGWITMALLNSIPHETYKDALGLSSRFGLVKIALEHNQPREKAQKPLTFFGDSEGFPTAFGPSS